MWWQCQDDVKEQQRASFSPGPSLTQTLSPGLYWLSSLFHHKAHRFIWWENLKLYSSIIMKEREASADWEWTTDRTINSARTPSTSEFTPTHSLGWYSERDQNPKQPLKKVWWGLIGGMLTNDGQQLVVLGKLSIIIGQTAVWKHFIFSFSSALNTNGHKCKITSCWEQMSVILSRSISDKNIAVSSVSLAQSLAFYL